MRHLVEAWRNAMVALCVIRAYQAYVRNDGDPSTLPTLSFSEDEFTVVLKDENS